MFLAGLAFVVGLVVCCGWLFVGHDVFCQFFGFLLSLFVLLFIWNWGWPCLLGLVLVFCGEFDPGSGRTLAACLTHASRTMKPGLFVLVD